MTSVIGRIAAFLFCAFAAPAVFASALSLPTGPWTVGVISAASDTGTRYCSMKNTYQNGMMLVFARDAGVSNSLAVDFRADTIEVGRLYPVTLTAGEDTRQMNALAATRQVLVIQMGQDRSFYQTMAAHNVLTLRFLKEEHLFGLDGTAASFDLLTACADTIAAKGDFTETTIPPSKNKEVGSKVTYQSPAPTIKKEEIKHGQGIKIPSLSDMAFYRSLEDQLRDLKISNMKLIAENQQLQSKLLESEQGLIMPEKKPAIDPVRPKNTPRVASDILALTAIDPVAQEVGEDVVLSWEKEGIFGAARRVVRKPNIKPASVIENYFQRMAKTCAGDFAYKAAPAQNKKAFQMVTGEMACVDGKRDAAAALLFLSENNQVDVILHEGTLDQMPDALAQRDAIVSAVSVGSIQ